MRKRDFGMLKAVAVKYVIIKLYPDDGKFRFVTKINTYPKEFFFEKGEQAKFFESRVAAEDYAVVFNLNGHSCFVMEVPDIFREEDFINKE